MYVNEVAIGQGVARFAAPPSAVPRRQSATGAPSGLSAFKTNPGPTSSQDGAPNPAARIATTDESATPRSSRASTDTAQALEATRAATEQAVEALEAQRAAKSRAGIRVHIDEETRRVVAEVLNNEREVIRQLPPEELLRIAARLDHVVGLLFDQRV